MFDTHFGIWFGMPTKTPPLPSSIPYSPRPWSDYPSNVAVRVRENAGSIPAKYIFFSSSEVQDLTLIIETVRTGVDKERADGYMYLVRVEAVRGCSSKSRDKHTRRVRKGRTHLLLALVLPPLTTHSFRDGMWAGGCEGDASVS